MSKASKTTRRQSKPDLDMTLPPADADRETLTARLRKLHRASLDFDRRLGKVRWLQGHILLRLKPQYSPKDWQAFLRSVGYKPTMAKYVMTIARKIAADQSDKLSFFEMLKICYKSFRDEVEKPEADEVQPQTAATGEAPAGEALAQAAPQARQPVEPEASKPAATVTIQTITRAVESFRSSLDSWLRLSIDGTGDEKSHLLMSMEATRNHMSRLEAKIGNQGMRSAA